MTPNPPLMISSWTFSGIDSLNIINHTLYNHYQVEQEVKGRQGQRPFFNLTFMRSIWRRSSRVDNEDISSSPTSWMPGEALLLLLLWLWLLLLCFLRLTDDLILPPPPFLKGTDGDGAPGEDDVEEMMDDTTDGGCRDDFDEEDNDEDEDEDEAIMG